MIQRIKARGLSFSQLDEEQQDEVMDCLYDDYIKIGLPLEELDNREDFREYLSEGDNCKSTFNIVEQLDRGISVYYIEIE